MNRARIAPLVIGGRLADIAARRFPWLYVVVRAPALAAPPTAAASPVDPSVAEAGGRSSGDALLQRLALALEGGVDLVHCELPSRRAVAAPAWRDDPWTAQLSDLVKRFDVPLIVSASTLPRMGGAQQQQQQQQSRSEGDVADAALAAASEHAAAVDAAVRLGCWVHASPEYGPPETHAELRTKITIPTAPRSAPRTTVFGYTISPATKGTAPYPPEPDYYLAGPTMPLVRVAPSSTPAPTAATTTTTATAATKGTAGASTAAAAAAGAPPSLDALGLDGLRAVVVAAKGDPVVAFGGITSGDIAAVMACGVAGIAVPADVLVYARHPESAARQLKEAMMRAATGNVPREGRSIADVLRTRRAPR
jgi:hypothetical protein